MDRRVFGISSSAGNQCFPRLVLEEIHFTPKSMQINKKKKKKNIENYVPTVNSKDGRTP